jgi:hypothetical protein
MDRSGSIGELNTAFPGDRVSKIAIMIVVVVLVAPGLSAEGTGYLAINAGVNKPLRQTSLGANAGIAGYFLVENLFLLGGYGGYIGNNEMHIGNGGLVGGIWQVLGDRIVVNVEGMAGLGGGMIRKEGGAVYLYGINAFVGYFYSSDACIGVILGYQSIHKMIAFKNSGEFEYYFLGLRLALIP